MSSILKALNLIAVPTGTSWEDLYGIDASALTNASRDNFFVLPLGNDKATLALCFYLGTGALTTSEFNNLPQGSVIVAPNIDTPTIYIKEGASTFNAIT
jgi:hypothetical protein